MSWTIISLSCHGEISYDHFYGSHDVKLAFEEAVDLFKSGDLAAKGWWVIAIAPGLQKVYGKFFY